MGRNFLADNFLLNSEFAERLYFDHAVRMPIYDYHCHLPVSQIAEDHKFENITQAWLYGDHYKWRAMRSNGVDEKYCTGNVSDYEKFERWAQTVPATIANPLYIWTHLELRRYFEIKDLLQPASAKKIYESTRQLLQSDKFSCRGLMRKMNVRLVCTTDDPLDNLEYHKQIAKENFEIKVLPTWRPDRAIATENLKNLNEWIDKLAALTDINVNNFDNFIGSLQQRHTYFHEAGCRISDHGIEKPYAANYSAVDIKNIFQLLRKNKKLNEIETEKFKSAVLHELCIMNHQKGWVQQFHIGPIRNNNSQKLAKIGPDSGFDSIGDLPIANELAKMLDNLENKLTKTILYNINPRDNELLATMAGNFQDSSTAGKIQFGAAWWFLDQRMGISKQLEVLSYIGLLSNFVGMLTDSRSFLSYPRHEYFRRILCRFIAGLIETGEIPADMDLLGKIVENICYNNAVRYFGIAL